MNRKELIKTLNRDLEKTINIISHAPAGNLVIRHKDCLALYIDSGKQTGTSPKERYIPKSDPRVKKYVNARYCRKQRPIVEHNLKALERFEKTYHPEYMNGVYSSFPEELRELIDPLASDVEAQSMIWGSEKYQSNGYEIHGGYKTAREELVRSKAECIIADILHEFGLSYRYEMIYEGQGWRSYPDFTVMHPKTGELYYIEYFGMMSDPDYLVDALKKISRYQNSADADHFLFFFESSANSMNTAAIRNTLKVVFLN